MTGQNGQTIDMEPGIYKDIPFEEYRKINAINHSHLKAFSEQSPFHYKFNLDNGTLFKETKALIDGRKIHESVLEPDVFDKKYVHTPTKWEPYRDMLPTKSVKKLEEDSNRMFDGRTKENELINQFFESSVKEDQEIMDYLDWYKFRQMRKSVYNNKACQKLFKNAEFEVTLVWIDEVTGLKCKGRLDVDSGPEMRAYFCDVKKTRSAQPYSFRRDIWKYNYNSQMAFYMDGATVLGHRPFKAGFWLAIEDFEPYYVQPFYTKANSAWISEGRKWYRDKIEKLHYCKSTGDWHRYHDTKNDDFEMYEIPDLEIA